MAPRIVVFVISFCCAGCVGGPRDGICTWSEERPLALDLNKAADQRHLNGDARAAEELAIRHADAARGHRSGQFAGVDDYRRTRDQCLAALTSEIASRHGIHSEQVAGAIGRRDGRLDALFLLLFVALYGLVANGAARRLLERFPQDEPWPAVISTAAAAIFASAAAVIVGGLGSMIVEMVQLGDAHLSYRAGRLPWQQHWLLLFLGGVMVFCCIAVAVRWREGQRDDIPSAFSDRA
jgi:hypothetical protein